MGQLLRQELLQPGQALLDVVHGGGVGPADEVGGAEAGAGDQQQIELLGPLAEGQVVRLQAAGEQVEGPARLGHMVAHLPQGGHQQQGEEQGGQSMGSLDMRNHLPSEVITDPISMEEAYRGSLKAMLKKNVGNYVVATFLVGTQSTTSWEGILYDVGNDYMTIYQEGRDRYIVSDIYSLKFIEFYDTRCRDICDEVLRSGWMPNQGM